jgi:hypothetical protein
MDRPPDAIAGRLLSFEVAGTAYALPIADVAEVAEIPPIAGIPTIPASVGGVVNHHGDALPVVRREVLFDIESGLLDAPRHLLVLARDPDDPEALGLPVDRVLGLVEGAGGVALGPDAVVERRPIDGRLVSVLDTQQLLRRAVEAIERSVIGPEPNHGGET